MTSRGLAGIPQRARALSIRSGGKGTAAMIRLRQKCQDNLQADHFVSQFLAGVFCLTILFMCLMIGVSSALSH